MEEATLLDFNKTRPQGQPKLVAIYPKEGTFFSDDPFMVLNAPWVTPAQKQARAGLPRVARARRSRRRWPRRTASARANPTPKPVAPITAANGVDPTEPKRAARRCPSRKVLARIKDAWHADRKPANIDARRRHVAARCTSENKLEQAKQGLQMFLAQLSPRDRVGLIYFDDTIRSGAPIAPFKPNAPRCKRLVGGLIADGEHRALRRDRARARRGRRAAGRHAHQRGRPAHRRPGHGLRARASRRSSHALTQRSREREAARSACSRSPTAATPTRTCSKRIATASGGKEYDGDPTQIEAVYLQISSFF